MVAFGVYTIPMVVFDIAESDSGLVRDYVAYSRYLILISVFLLSLCTAFRLSKDAPLPPRKRLENSMSLATDRAIAIIIACFSGVVCLIVVPLAFGGYEVIATTARGQLQIVSPLVGLLSGFYYVMNFAVLFMFNCVKNKKDWLLGFAISLFLTNTIFYLVTGDRKFLVFYFVGLAFHLIRLRKLRLSHLIITTLVVFLVLNAFRKVRDIRGQELADYTDHISNNFAIDWFSLRDSEFSAHFFIGEYVLTNNTEPPLLGFSYISAFANLVPKIIWRDEQFKSLALTFATTYDGDYAARGGGFAYSFVIEAYQNFSYVGPALVGLLLGWILKRVQVAVITNASPLFWTMQSVLLGLLVIVPRTEFDSLLKQTVAGGVIPLLMYTLCKLFARGLLGFR